MRLFYLDELGSYPPLRQTGTDNCCTRKSPGAFMALSATVIAQRMKPHASRVKSHDWVAGRDFARLGGGIPTRLLLPPLPCLTLWGPLNKVSSYDMPFQEGAGSC